MKKVCKIVCQVVALIVFGVLGNMVSEHLPLPIPGSLLGMFLLLGCLFSGIIKEEWVELGAAVLIGDLLLFFIPSATGIIQYTNLFGATGATLVGIVFVSILFVIASVVISTRVIAGLQKRGFKI